MSDAIADAVAKAASDVSVAEAAASAATVDAAQAAIDTAAAEASADAAAEAAQQAAVAAVAASAVADANAAQSVAAVAGRIDECLTRLTSLETALTNHTHPELMAELTNLRASISSILPASEAAPEAEIAVIVEPSDAVVADLPAVAERARRRMRVL